MAGSLLKVVLLCILILAGILCVLGPVIVLAVMSWHWRKELAESARLRRGRSTQIR